MKDTLNVKNPTKILMQFFLLWMHVPSHGKTILLVLSIRLGTCTTYCYRKWHYIFAIVGPRWHEKSQATTIYIYMGLKYKRDFRHTKRSQQIYSVNFLRYLSLAWKEKLNLVKLVQSLKIDVEKSLKRSTCQFSFFTCSHLGIRPVKEGKHLLVV